MSTLLEIDIFADIACPWCYIGERRLEQALESTPEITARRRWRPFQLQPQMPLVGLPWRAFAAEKFGGAARAAELFAHMEAVGAEAGLTFDYARIQRAPNTLDAHRLILLARAFEREWPMARALFAGYFGQGRDLNNRDELLALAGEAGVDVERARAWLDGDSGVAEVYASQQQAYELGVGGVPFYVINQRYGISGAQPAGVFVQALRRAVQQIEQAQQRGE